MELRALRARQPELADAVDMHLELLELERRIQGRVSLPLLDLTEANVARHQAEARPLLKFEDIPLDLTDLRLMVRQTADILRRYGADWLVVRRRQLVKRPELAELGSRAHGDSSFVLIRLPETP